MVRISYLMRRLPQLSLEEFQSYWSEKHPQAAPEDAFSTLGVKRYVQVLPLETDARNVVIGPRTGLVEPFDGIAELWVESIEALERDWSTEKAKEYLFTAQGKVAMCFRKKGASECWDAWESLVGGGFGMA
jgi:hypothetical protein